MVVPFDIPHLPDVTGRDEIDRDPFTTETTGSANPVNVVGSFHGQVEINDQINLLAIKSTREAIRCEQYTAGTAAEFFDYQITIPLVHFSVQRTARKVTLWHFLQQPIDFSFGSAKDYSLWDRQGFVQITQTV